LTSRAIRTSIINFLSFAYFAKHQEELTGRALTGAISNLHGYVAERVVAQHLEAAGHDVSFPHIPNQEGFDLLVDGHPFQVKCLLDAGSVHEHLHRFDYPVIVNAELAHQVGHLDKVYVDPALRHEAIVNATKDTLHHGAGLTDLDIPWISLGVSAILPGYRWFNGDTDAAGFATTLLTNTVGRTVFGTAGSKAAALACLALFGPAGAVVGGGVGAILGSSVGRSAAAAARRFLTAGEREELAQARTAVIDQSIEAARPRHAAWQRKAEELESCLGGFGRGRPELRQYIARVHEAEIRYQEARLSDLKALRNRLDGLDDYEASQRALVLMKRSGVHPHFFQAALKRLLSAMDALRKSQKRWVIVSI
jgi:hypothetical protein